MTKTLPEWLSNLEHRNAQEIQLGLDRIQTVAEKLQLHHPHCPVITVAGTNGKGSTVTALEHIYQTAGYRTAVYTSPHLIHFNERIRFDLSPISDHDLCLAFSIIDVAREHTMLTYFEMTTLAALWYFKEKQPDIIILEVGLGGRLDATNIVDADVSVITTIDFDHQDFLGDTLEAIAYEKAGILRQGKPFIYADANPPKSVSEVATQLSAPAYLLNEQFSIIENEASWGFQYRELHIRELPKPKIQLKSAAAAIMASILLKHQLPINGQSLSDAMQAIIVPGRLELQKGTVNVLYDVAHNPQSARLLAETLSKFNESNKVHAVFSALKDKDILGLIEPMKDYVDHWFPAQLDVKRAISVNLLLTYFRNAEISVEVGYTNPILAFEAALNQANPGDLIVVYGSFYTVGQVMAAKPNRGYDETSNG